MAKFPEDIARAVSEENLFERTVTKPPATLPQTATAALFSIVGAVKILEILGEVTTVIQTQNCTAFLVSVPTLPASSSVKLSGSTTTGLNISADAVGTMYNITGTLANAMVATTGGTHIAQAGAIVVAAGNLSLSCRG